MRLWSDCRSGRVEPREPGQLGLTLFDKAAEPLVEDHTVLNADVRIEAGLIAILLKHQELAGIVALSVDGEFGVAGLAPHVLGQTGDQRSDLRLCAWLGRELRVQN